MTRVARSLAQWLSLSLVKRSRLRRFLRKAEANRQLACFSLRQSPMASPRARPHTHRVSSRDIGAACLGAGSWMGLLAATTLGVAGASTVRAQVRAGTALSEGRPYRLVVQSYDPFIGGDVPSVRARPLASMQRQVTAAEMKRGVQVDLLELRQVDGSADGGALTPTNKVSREDDGARGNLARALVVAWVEEGQADLEYDGRRARPQPGSFVGAVRRDANQGSVSISVKPGV
jgi:hypothetical protein